MKERPILFSSAMVRAILEGKKTQTRRVVKLAKLHPEFGAPLLDKGWIDTSYMEPEFGRVPCLKMPFSGEAGETQHRHFPDWEPDDRAVVKEAAWMWCEKRENGKSKTGRQKYLYVPLRAAPVVYCADTATAPTFPGSPHTDGAWAWRKKIGRFLPLWASRITLEILSVRVERVQDISEADVVAEGVKTSIGSGAIKGEVSYHFTTNNGYMRGLHGARSAFGNLWDSIAKPEFKWASNCWVWLIEFKRV